ncbi:MAG: hypothetical protein H8D77_01345 [Chloroflexi bacterium]|nr:hypothetical protein [Chloroflexota bacterium]MBL7200924.1 hypothetical protein [Anaerolineae bacterium]
MTPMLQPDERVQLQRILSQYPDFVQAQGRVVLMRISGVADVVSGVDLSGVPRTVAGSVLLRLEDYGQLPARPGYHALGALLSYLLGLGDLPVADAKVCAKMIVQYALVDDPDSVSDLRARYGLAGVEVVGPKEERVERSLPANMYQTKYLTALRELILERLSEVDVRTLCMDLGADYDDLGGSGKRAKVLSLVQYVHQRRCFPKLLVVGKDLRDDIDWEEVFRA